MANQYMKPRSRTVGSWGAIAAALCASLVLSMAGCATAPRAAAYSPADEARAADPAWRSELYDKATTLLSDAAFDEDPLLRANSMEGLHEAPELVESIARAGLMDDNLGVRYVAAMTIGKLSLKDSAVFVQPVASDPSAVVRAAAIYALRRNGVDADPTPLASMLESGKLTERAQAAFILGELGDSSAIGLLKSAARRSSPLASKIEDRLVRLQIAEALIKLGSIDSIETIRAALFPSRPEDLEATALAVQIIGNVNDRRSRDQLIYLTARSGPEQLPAEIRLLAAQSLAKLGVRRGSFIADEYWQGENPAVRAQAAFVLGATDNPANLGKLEEMLLDPVGVVRVAAATSILRALSLRAEMAGVDTHD
jgi:HEAT repeat protein